MACLTLRCENALVKRYGVGQTVTIGRVQDNAIVIDDPAVSSHHACVFPDRDDFVLEDLQSTNGTFVKGKRVSRRVLQHDDVIEIGKHTLVFDQHEDGALNSLEDEVIASKEGETIFLDAQQHQRLMTILLNAEARAAEAHRDAAAPEMVGVLRVLAGRANRAEYRLEGHTSLIGGANWTLIRLKGWFQPNISVAITRNQFGYVATRIEGRMLVNSVPIDGRCDLKEGDILAVGGLTLQFGLAQCFATERASGDPAPIENSFSQGVLPLSPD